MSKVSSPERGGPSWLHDVRRSGRHRTAPRRRRGTAALAGGLLIAGAAVLGLPATAGSDALAAPTTSGTPVALSERIVTAGKAPAGQLTGTAGASSRASQPVAAALRAGAPPLATSASIARAASVRAAAVLPDLASGSVAEAGEILLPGRFLHTGTHRLLLTRNGDLELFSGSTRVWSSGTSGHPGARAVMQADGNLVLRTRGGKAIWSTRTAGRPGARLLVRRVAEVIIQSRNGRVVWRTTPAPVTTSSVKGYAIAQLAVRGWGADQWPCLQSLWQRESGWDSHAANPSGAYGIPQALPGSKMASAGSDWQTNPQTQIRWGLGYIADRYGSPCSAWAHSESNGWY